MITERWLLALERIQKIPKEDRLKDIRRAYFSFLSEFIMKMDSLFCEVTQGEKLSFSLLQMEEKNRDLYRDLLEDNYDRSYANPAYACGLFGKEEGQLLSFLYCELRNLIVYAYEQDRYEMVIRAELFLEIYGAYLVALEEDGRNLPVDRTRQILYWFVSDYYEEEEEKRIKQLLDPSLDFAVKIIMDSDLSDIRYLYRYGEYVSEDEKKIAMFMNLLPEETIRLMSDTYTEGYRTGFVNAGKDLTRKKTVNIRYSLGFERMVRYAVTNFEKMGLKPVIYRASGSIFGKKGVNKIGYFGACPNRQYEYDHKDDIALLLDGHLITRKLECMKAAFLTSKELAAFHAGPACIETFGEEAFSPKNQPYAVRMSAEQSKMMSEFKIAGARLTNQFIPQEQRSFTIIAFPTPRIGEPFSDIFADIIRINTLDVTHYRQIQQKLIDALDFADHVIVRGMDGNQTNLCISLCKLNDPSFQTKFENCLADVNIPLGEVFTSPVLRGTNGTLHVKRVFLNELEYRDLNIQFTDGMVTNYSCSNFTEESQGRKYIEDNVLYHHTTLPVGEFAIGTNTLAYAIAKKYGISSKLPILIAEKMGPHFALGDTCYSEEEEIKVYNPDGKEVIARENEISAKRKENPSESYFGCHTDITIPYDELGLLTAVDCDNKQTDIIRNGRFVLPGTEELNDVLV